MSNKEDNKKPNINNKNDKKEGEPKRRGRPPKILTEEERNKTKYQKYKEYQQNYHKKYFQENKAKYNEASKLRRKKIKKLLKDNNLNVKDVVIV